MSDKTEPETEIESESETETKTGNDDGKQEIFSAAFFAALTGVSSRAAGQDPGSVVNEAFTLADRAVERMTTDKPLLTDAARATAREITAAQVVGSVGATILSGARFPRPSASRP